MKLLPLKKGQFAKVDDEDFEYLVGLGEWIVYNGYPACRINGDSIRIHTIILKQSPGYEIDHINSDKLDNQKANLRMVTHQQNMCNMKMHKDNTSGFKGVMNQEHRQPRRPWVAQIMSNGKYKRIGSFATAQEAAVAYDEWAEKLHGEFARTNKSMGLL